MIRRLLASGLAAVLLLLFAAGCSDEDPETTTADADDATDGSAEPSDTTEPEEDEDEGEDDEQSSSDFDTEVDDAIEAAEDAEDGCALLDAIGGMAVEPTTPEEVEYALPLLELYFAKIVELGSEEFPEEAEILEEGYPEYFDAIRDSGYDPELFASDDSTLAPEVDEAGNVIADSLFNDCFEEPTADTINDITATTVG